MRVCTKWGNADNVLWENCRFKRNLDLMRIEDFKREYPEIGEQVEREKYVWVKTPFHFIVYHKSGKYVLRRECFSKNEPFYDNFEAHHKRKTPISDFGNRRKKDL